jgi:hypothetical protein
MDYVQRFSAALYSSMLSNPNRYISFFNFDFCGVVTLHNLCNVRFNFVSQSAIFQ